MESFHLQQMQLSPCLDALHAVAMKIQLQDLAYIYFPLSLP